MVRQHRLTVLERLVVVVIVQSSCCRTAAADGQIGRHSTGEVLLLAVEIEEAFELALTKPRLTVPHDVDVRFGRNLTGPLQSFDFFVILDGSRLS